MKIRKKLLRTSMIVAAGLVACFATSGIQAATTLVVGGCKHATVNYTTIQSAVNAASPGTTIDVCPGTYAEQVTITTDNLTLIGILATNGQDAAVIIPPTAGLVGNGQTYASEDISSVAVAQVLVQNAVAVTISHITVDAQGSGSCNTGMLMGIYYQNSTGTVTDSVARNGNIGTGDQCGWGIAAESTSSLAFTVSNSSVHNFNKNGICVRGTGSTGPSLTATGNTVLGIGPTDQIAQNGIEVAFGASGSVKSNYVADLLYTGPVINGTATGILFYQATGSAVAETNVVESANTGIGDNFDTGSTISSNHIGGTQIFDGIDLCSSGDTASGNIIFNSTNSGIHIDDTCGSGTAEIVKTNTINEACAGLLLGTSGNPGMTTPNTYENDGYETQPGDSCTPPSGPTNQVTGKSGAQSKAKAGKARP